MDEGDDDFLRLLGPPPYQLEERHLKRIFASYKPRDITIKRLLEAPPWIERAGVGSRLYQLFWLDVPLIIPAEACLDPGEDVTGPVSAELEYLDLVGPSDIAWENLTEFIEKYFLDPTYNWLADGNTIIYEIPLSWSFEDSIASSQQTFPTIDVSSLFLLFDVFEELQCWDHPKRLSPVFIWKDSRGNRQWSKQPNTKRNIRPELGISQHMHKVLDDALELWGQYLAGRIEISMNQTAFRSQLCMRTREYIEYLYAPSKEQRGYMKYWMTHAFDAFSRPGMKMDTDMWSWTTLCLGTIIQPRPDFIKSDHDQKRTFGFVIDNGSEDEEDETRGEVEEAEEVEEGEGDEDTEAIGEDP